MTVDYLEHPESACQVQQYHAHQCQLDASNHISFTILDDHEVQSDPIPTRDHQVYMHTEVARSWSSKVHSPLLFMLLLNVPYTSLSLAFCGQSIVQGI